MLNNTYEARLVSWREFRDDLEKSIDPIQDCLDFWQQFPEVSFQADPYNRNTWPTAWQMIEENVYCPFVKILAICYTLQLTECFSGARFEIHIIQANNNINYLISIDEKYVGNFSKGDHVSPEELFKSSKVEQSYLMPSLL
jgi:hypothetical protein